MKKLSVLLALFLLVFAVEAFAQGTFRDIFIKSPATVKAEQQAPAFRSLFDATMPLPINLTGDTLYLVSAGTWGVGVGVDVASWKGILTLRAEASASDTDKPFFGAGVFLNLPKAISMISGVEWNAAFINPSIGVVPGFDLGKNKFDVGLVLSIVQVTF